jgi:hypothetical protein
LYVVYAALALIGSLAYWIVTGHFYLFLFVFPLISAAISSWIGVALLRLRYTALIAARLWALWGVVAFVGLVVMGKFVDKQPVLTLVRSSQLVTAIGMAIAIFLPAVSNAIKKPADSTGG